MKNSKKRHKLTEEIEIDFKKDYPVCEYCDEPIYKLDVCKDHYTKYYLLSEEEIKGE